MAMKVDMSALETNFANMTFPASDDTYFSAGAPDVPSMVLPTCDDVSTPSPPHPLSSPTSDLLREGGPRSVRFVRSEPWFPSRLPRSSTGSRRTPRPWWRIRRGRPRSPSSSTRASSSPLIPGPAWAVIYVSTLSSSQTWLFRGRARVFRRVESVGKFRSLCGIWRLWQPVSDALLLVCGIGKKNWFLCEICGICWCSMDLFHIPYDSLWWLMWL